MFYVLYYTKIVKYINYHCRDKEASKILQV